MLHRIILKTCSGSSVDSWFKRKIEAGRARPTKAAVVIQGLLLLYRFSPAARREEIVSQLNIVSRFKLFAFICSAQIQLVKKCDFSVLKGSVMQSSLYFSLLCENPAVTQVTQVTQTLALCQLFSLWAAVFTSFHCTTKNSFVKWLQEAGNQRLILLFLLRSVDTLGQ